MQTKIHRALQDAPLATSAATYRSAFERLKGGYRMEAFLAPTSGRASTRTSTRGSASSTRSATSRRANRRPGADSDFPFAEDPSLWASLELVEGK